MSTIIDSSIWCELATNWIMRNGCEDLDALQFSRFKEHAAHCERCGALLRGGSEVDGLGVDNFSQDAVLPHLADETLHLMATGGLSQKEHVIIDNSAERHLQSCDYCLDRLAAFEEWPEEMPESREAVVGRAATQAVHWVGHHGELGWVMDQATTGVSLWRVVLSRSSDTFEAELSVEGDTVPKDWRFALSLADGGEPLPTVVFTPESLKARYGHMAATRVDWQATPILTIPLPAWTRLVSVGEDPATMISLDDAERREIALRIPYEGPQEYETISPWLNSLLVDLRGERMTFAVARQESAERLAGAVLNRKGGQVGYWDLRFFQDGLGLVVTPANDEVLRLATVIDGSPQVYLPTNEAAQDEASNLPAYVISVARMLQNFDLTSIIQRVIGFSGSYEYVATAASGAVEHIVGLDRLAGGTVILEVMADGGGVIRGRFEVPDSILVAVYDPTRDAPLSITKEDDAPSQSVELRSGDSMTPVRLTLHPECRPEDLRLVVLRNDL